METPTLDNLEVPIMDEYHREEMENLEIVAVHNPHKENAIPRYVWDHPDFEDISAWETNQPADEYMGGNFGHPTHHESLTVGSEFDSKELAVHAVRKWSIKNRVEYVVNKSNPSFIKFRCRKAGEGCPWALRISSLRNSARWEVRKHREHHICQNDTIMAINVHMTPKYIAKELWDVMTEKLRLSGAEIQARIYKDYGLEISPLKAWQAKQQTMIDLFGTWDGSFECLPHLMKALVDNSLETVVYWDTDEIDGEYIQTRRIMATMKEPQWSPPNAYHRICVHHFQSNFNTKVKDSYLKKKLGKVAYAKKEYKFAAQYEELMKEFKDRPDVREWLRKVDPHLWSLALDTDGMRWGSMTTNASESFNNVLKHGRDLPISALVMFTFKQLNKYFHTLRYRFDNTESDFAPKVHERLEVLRARAQFHRVVPFNRGQGIYQSCNCGL
ncbi:hypothetical protein QQ045_021884 [Rhodiola kirilowii]